MKRFLAMLLALAMMFSLAACSGSSSSDQEDSSADNSTETTTETASDEEAEEEDVYRVFSYGTTANCTTFDPASDLTANSGIFLVHAVGETLWTLDEDGNISLRLAESYSYDGDTLVITVKQGIQFSNGDELDGEDVLATLKHLATTTRTASSYSSLDVDNATVDGYTVTIPLLSYDASLIDALSNANAMILDSEVITEDYDYSWLIGTGPYMLETWNESVNYILVRNPNYWSDEPYYDELDVYFYSDEATRYADFQSGKLDAIFVTESTYVNNLADGVVDGAYLVQETENYAYGFTLAYGEGTTGTFADINIRKALAHALDVEAMVEVLGEGIYTVATSLVSETSWAYLDVGVYEYDPELAAEYLALAGYSVDNPLTIYVCCEYTAWHSALFEAAQSYCAAIGINLDLSGVGDLATILPTLLASEHDMAIAAGSGGSGNDPANLMVRFNPGSDNALARVSDETLVSIWYEAISTSDIATRTELYQTFIQTIHDEYLFIPVYFSTKNYGVLSEHTSFESALTFAHHLDPTLLTD